MLAASQRDQKLKFELLVPITSQEKPTACLSFNYHQDHFGSLWGIDKNSDRYAKHLLQCLIDRDNLEEALKKDQS